MTIYCSVKFIWTRVCFVLIKYQLIHIALSRFRVNTSVIPICEPHCKPCIIINMFNGSLMSDIDVSVIYHSLMYINLYIQLVNNCFPCGAFVLFGATCPWNLWVSICGWVPHKAVRAGVCLGAPVQLSQVGTWSEHGISLVRVIGLRDQWISLNDTWM